MNNISFNEAFIELLVNFKGAEIGRDIDFRHVKVGTLADGGVNFMNGR